MSNTPDIRFKGFTIPWEQRKLEKIYQKIRNAFVGTATPYYVDSGHFYLESNNVKEGQINHNTEVFINDEFYERQKDNWLHTGDLVMVQSGHVGHTAVIPENLNNTAAHALIIIASPVEEISPYFVNYQFQTQSAKDYIDNITTGNTIKHILASEIKKFEIVVPLYEEQAKIETFFKSLDNLITLHQHKCDEVSELKKFMLQKVFPKSGEQFPEIRFSGFTAPWEQRKLGNIADKVTTKNSDTQYVETLTNSAEYGIISQRDFFDHDVSNMENIDGYYVVEDDAFVYNPRISTSAPVGPINRNKLGRTGVMSPLYTVFKTHDIDLEYLEWFFKSTRWHAYMKFNGDSGARADRFSIKDAVFFEMPIPIPDIDEQKKIGKYITKIDNLITLHQRKCDELKELKKYMLQNMFPKKG